MVAKIILNPYANRWRALQRREEAVAALTASGLEYELEVTSAPGEAVEIAEKAARAGYSPIVAAGGDGTIGEVVNGIAQAAGLQDGDPCDLTTFGVIPLGSANDMVDNLGLPRDLNRAAEVIARGQTRQLDLCSVEWKSLEGTVKKRFFANNAAIGLEPYITLIQQKIHRIQGTPRYLVATLRGVMDNPRWEMELAWEDGEYSGPTTLVTVGNSPRTGGLFYVTPHADPYDGRLTFVYGFLPTRRQVMQALPMLMKPGPGNYVEHPAIHEIHSPWLRIRSHQPTPLHTDGEIQSQTVQQLEFRVIRGALPILTS